MGNSPTIDYKMSLTYFAVAFSDSGKLRLILAPIEIVQLTENLITNLFKIQEIRKYDGVTEFKLEGCPTGNLRKKKLIDLKNLLAVLIQNYYSTGWNIKSNMCLDIYGKNGSTIIFEKDMPITTIVSCLSFDGVDTINVLGPESFSQIINEILKNDLSFKGNEDDWITFKINKEYNIVEMADGIFKRLYEANWLFCGSIQMNYIEMGSLYFRHVEKLTPMQDMFGLYLSKSNKITIINSQSFITELIKKTIELEWDEGTQSQRAKSANVYEFKLYGNPWLNKIERSIDSRRLFNKIVENLYDMGYKIYSICDFSLNERKMSTFYFYSIIKMDKTHSISPKIMSLSLNESDKLRITDNLGGFSYILRHSIKQMWPKGLNLETKQYGSLEFKLNGSPFSPYCSKNDTIHFSMLILVLFENLKRLKCLKFIGSADLCSDYINIESIPYGFNIHTLLFQCDQ